MTGIIIQARTGSTRLPGKVLFPFGPSTMLEYCINRTLLSRLADTVIVATTTDPDDDAIQKLCEKKGVPVYRGPENDVLQRYIDAAQHFGIQVVVRVCADNPFIDPSYIDRLIEAYTRKPADYYSFQFSSGVPAIMSPIGFFGELVTLKALLSVKSNNAPPQFFEHVTQYVYRHPERYSVRYLPVPAGLESARIRLTVDTKEDYAVALKAGRMIGFDVSVSASAVYRAVLKRPDLMKKMHDQIQSNPKA